MRAVVLKKPCSPEELEVIEVEIPKVKPGWVLIEIKAFGINHSELFTRQGYSPSVKLPRIIGIECVGVISDPSDSDFTKGQKVISLMGGLGRQFDGSYAEYTLVPTEQVYPVNSSLDFAQLAAIPETYFTAYGSLFETLCIKEGETILIRGGTSTVGLAALQLAKAEGLTVIATTRSEDKIELLKQNAADYVLVDRGSLSEQLNAIGIEKVDKVLELVGTGTLIDSLKLVAKHGIVCMTGALAGWELESFQPMEAIPTGSYLSIFSSDIITKQYIEEMFAYIENKSIKTLPPQTFHLEEISKVHRRMEDSKGNGKMVVVL